MPEVTGSEPPNERVLSKEDAEELRACRPSFGEWVGAAT